MRNNDAIRQTLGQLVVVKVDVQVRQNCLSRPHFFNPFKGLCDMAVSWMRLIPQRINDPVFDPVERRERCVIEARHITTIGYIPDAESQ